MHLIVAPLVGAWIEMVKATSAPAATVVAPLVGAWIEISGNCYLLTADNVAPLVGAWIEILKTVRSMEIRQSRSPRGSVD